VIAVGFGALIVGAGLAALFYRSQSEDRLAEVSPGLFGALVALRESFDGAYDYYVAKIQQRLAMVLNFIDQIFVSGLIIRGAAGVVGLVGLGVRALHVGRVSAYVLWILGGAVVLWAFATGLF
jgi:NADH-quinone oxidoreductase subunit L